MGTNGEGHTLVLYVRGILELESVVGTCFCWSAHVALLTRFQQTVICHLLSSPYECKRSWSCKYADECADWTHYLPSSVGKKATADIIMNIHTLRTWMLCNHQHILPSISKRLSKTLKCPANLICVVYRSIWVSTSKHSWARWGTDRKPRTDRCKGLPNISYNCYQCQWQPKSAY